MLWCVTRPDLFAPALAQVGLPPGRVIYVEAGDEKELLSCICRWTAPGLPEQATRKARRTISGSFPGDLTCTDILVTGSKSLAQSSSFRTPRPSQMGYSA